MDSFELNKIAGAVLAACLFAMVVGKVSDMIVHPHALEKPSIDVPVVEEAAPAAGGEVAKAEPIAPLMANANVANGEAAFAKRCATCHTVDKGGANKVGPNLWNIMGAKHAHLDNYSYSKAMQDTHDRTWDYQSMSEWITRPSAYIRGTKMAFAGIGNANERADIIAFLREKADNPLPLPDPSAGAEEKPAEEKPAEGGQGQEQPAQGQEQPAQQEQKPEQK